MKKGKKGDFMHYSDELEKRFRDGYQGYERPEACGDTGMPPDILLNLNVKGGLNTFNNYGWYGENIAHLREEDYFDEDYIQKLCEETNLAFYTLPQPGDFYLGLTHSIQEQTICKDDDILPSSFYKAIERNAFKRFTNNTVSDYTGLNKNMKTRGDLPKDFIDGMKSGEIREVTDDGGYVTHQWNFVYKQLPLSFYEALKRNAFKIKKDHTLVDYPGLNENMKTFSDLPADFIEGVKSGDIILNPEKDDDLTKECLSNFTASVCRRLPKRPLVLLIHGDHKGHSSAYIARISEDNRCELLSLNSCEAYKKPDKLFIESLKEGVKKGLGLKDKDFAKPIYKVIQQRSFACVFIASILLSLVDPDQKLSEQKDNLLKAMDAMIKHDKMTRRLVARILWWNQVVNSKRARHEDGHWEAIQRDTKKLEQAMHEVFRQLAFRLCEIPVPTKISLSEDPEIFKECAKFLHVFNIEINDPTFLKLFNKVEHNLLDEVSEELSEDQEKYFDPDNWTTNKETLANKLFDEITEDREDLKNAFYDALDDLAKHARNNLDSTSTTTRAEEGRQKYKALASLLEDVEDLDSLQDSVKKFLNVKNPAKSTLLKNRGGFFGAYEKFSSFVNYIGVKHYQFGDRTAISRTDHYLIALNDAIDDLEALRNEHHSDSNLGNSSKTG